MTAHQPRTIVIKNTPTTLTITSQIENEMLDDLYGDGAEPRKRRRLTHLSTEEKMLRRYRFLLISFQKKHSMVNYAEQGWPKLRLFSGPNDANCSLASVKKTLDLYGLDQMSAKQLHNINHLRGNFIPIKSHPSHIALHEPMLFF